ncbi:MAG: hypothetical protein ACP5RS_01835 [Thermoplasmata archaeon]
MTKKSNIISIRFTDEELEALQKLMADNEIDNLSEMIRLIIKDYSEIKSNDPYSQKIILKVPLTLYSNIEDILASGLFNTPDEILLASFTYWLTNVLPNEINNLKGLNTQLKELLKNVKETNDYRINLKDFNKKIKG